jgi:hypothetical protein
MPLLTASLCPVVDGSLDVFSKLTQFVGGSRGLFQVVELVGQADAVEFVSVGLLTKVEPSASTRSLH